jgi:FdhE protein
VTEFQPGMDFKDFADAIDDSGELIDEYIKAVLQRDSERIERIAHDNRIGTDEFLFVMINWMKPLFVSLMEHYRENVDLETWVSPDCPLCGYYPAMSMIADSEEGKHYLHCSLCEMLWSFKRVTCTICGNEDQKKLGYFILEDKEAPYRIDYCDVCKGYIKTLRIPKLRDPSKFDLTVENILTVNFDNAAIHRGYSRP